MGPLTYEQAINIFSRVEEQRLHYLRYGRQDQRRTQLSLQTYDVRRNRGNAFTDGQPEDEFTLELSIPTSFLGSRQQVLRQVANALALARVYRKPLLFITVITNPRWPKIEEHLLPGQRALDNPQLVSRVFYVRLLNLIRFLKRQVQKIVYIVRVIKFQKRGLPHAYILLKVPYSVSYPQTIKRQSKG